MPVVSVIIPTYNHARFLPYALKSVLEQTFPDFEVIIVDDGSTDDTSQVVQNVVDTRVRYIYQNNQGLAASRNSGLRAARGEYVAFLDADDLLLPRKLEVQVDWLNLHGEHGLVAGGWHLIDEQGKLIGSYRPGSSPPALMTKDWLYSCRVTVHSVLVRKHWVEFVGGFDEGFRRVEDWDLWLRLVHAGCKMGWVDYFVCCYRMSPGQMTKDAAAQELASIRMMDKFFGQPGLPYDLAALKPKVYSHLYITSAGREYAAGQCEEAKESLERAMQYDPILTNTWKPEQVLELISWSNIVWFNADPIDYAQRVFGNLPKGATALQYQKHWALGEVGLKTLFTAYQAGDWHRVRRAALVVIRNAPHRMNNRGIWSILWRSVRHTMPLFDTSG